MYIVYIENRKPSLFLTVDSANKFGLENGGITWKLRPLRDEEQANVVAFASVSRKNNEIALFFDYSKAFIYASRRDAVVQNLIVDLDA